MPILNSSARLEILKNRKSAGVGRNMTSDVRHGVLHSVEQTAKHCTRYVNIGISNKVLKNNPAVAVGKSIRDAMDPIKACSSVRICLEVGPSAPTENKAKVFRGIAGEFLVLSKGRKGEVKMSCQRCGLHEYHPRWAIQRGKIFCLWCDTHGVLPV